MTTDAAQTAQGYTSRRSWRRVLMALVLISLGGGAAAAGLSLFAPTAPYMTALTDLVLSPFADEDTSLNIVVVSSNDDGEHSFTNGVRFAVTEINDTPAKVLGRRVNVSFINEAGISPTTALEQTVAKTLKLSGKVARTENLLAVIGHEWSDTAVTASSIYARNDILFLATQATATSLTNHNFDTVFALQPDNATNAEMMARYALSRNLRRIIVLSDKTDYAKESANFFTAAMTNSGADIIYRGYLSGTKRSVDDLLMFVLDNQLFKRSDFDAFFIVSSTLEETTEFIKRSRYLGLDVPILGLEYMFSEAVEDAVGKADMKDVVGVSLYDRDNISSSARTFADNYKTNFNALPDLNAALGYDSANLVRDAVNRAKTVDPQKVADALKVARYKAPFVGVTGPLVFDRNGLITDTHVFIVRHDGTDFSTVAAYKIPLDLEGSTFDDHLQGDDGPAEPPPGALPSAKETIGQ